MKIYYLHIYSDDGRSMMHRFKSISINKLVVRAHLDMNWAITSIAMGPVDKYVSLDEVKEETNSRAKK